MNWVNSGIWRTAFVNKKFIYSRCIAFQNHSLVALKYTRCSVPSDTPVASIFKTHFCYTFVCEVVGNDGSWYESALPVVEPILSRYF